MAVSTILPNSDGSSVPVYGLPEHDKPGNSVSGQNRVEGDTSLATNAEVEKARQWEAAAAQRASEPMLSPRKPLAVVLAAIRRRADERRAAGLRERTAAEISADLQAERDSWDRSFPSVLDRSETGVSD